MSTRVDFTSEVFDPTNYMPKVIAYKAITQMADGFDSYCAPCGDFYVYDCPNECGGIFCVCCMDGCDECGAVIDFTA